MTESEPDERGSTPEPRTDVVGPVAGIILGLVLWRVLPSSLALPVRLAAVVLVIAFATWVSIQISARRR
jgi:hypothetical protein